MYRIVALGLLLLPALQVRAGDAERDRATLRGVKAVNLVVDRLDPDLEQLGVTQDMVRARIEDRFRDAGISVDTRAVEFVGFRINSMIVKKGDSGLCFSIAFYQPVVLARDQKVRTASPTWDVNAILVVPPKPLVTSALHTVDQLADRFAEAYRSVNPR